MEIEHLLCVVVLQFVHMFHEYSVDGVLYEIFHFEVNYYVERYVQWLRVCSYNSVGLKIEGIII